jgi:hypothetical protein
MDDTLLNDRFDAISGKLDVALTRQLENEAKMHDLLYRIAAIQRRPWPSPPFPAKGRRLGKRAAKHDPRTLQLGKYLTSDIPAPPASVNNSYGITSWGMMLNDQLGDCTIAGCGHAVQAWTAANGNELTLPDSVILSYYETWDGYVLGDPSTDQGGVEVNVLNNWRKYGFGYRKGHVGSDILYAYADPSPGNVTHIKQAISLFGGVYIGIELPITAQSQTIWDVVGNPQTDPNSAPGSWGGHCVWVLGYDANYLTCVTWGGLLKMTWAFWAAYCDESHALLSHDFVKLIGKSPSGFDLDTLKQDLQLVIA